MADCRSRIAAAGSEANRVGMARYGIRTDNAAGAGIPALRAIARDHRRDHALALALWATGGHEERILAGMVEDVAAATPAQLDAWVADLDSWDVCDQVVPQFDRIPEAPDLLLRWVADEREFVRRAGFVMIAARAVHGKDIPDEAFLPYLDLIEAHAEDDRNFVCKAVNWALRQIGKRSPALRLPAVACAERLIGRDNRTARWIGRDARRELTSRAVIERQARVRARKVTHR
nr:DNA alkylation repair protein [Chthonobacter albigriseus]